MRKLTDRLSVRQMLWAGFGAVALVQIVASVLLLLETRRVERALVTITEQAQPKAGAASEISIEVGTVARALRDAVLVEVQEDLDVEAGRANEASAVIQKHLAYLQKNVLSEDERKLLDAVKTAGALYAKQKEEFLDLLRGGQRGVARGMLSGVMRKSQAAYLDALRQFREFQWQQVQTASADVAARLRQSLIQSLVSLLLVLAIGTVAVLTIGRALYRQLGAEPRDVANAVRRVAAGDLAMQLPQSRGDQDSVMSSLHAMVDQLHDSVHHVRSGALVVADASSEIAVGNSNLAARTEQQAANVQQTAATLEQFVSTIEQTSESVRQADSLSVKARNAADSTETSITAVVDMMQRLTQASERMGEIIGVIDGIAFQTNVLSLNASVEAARAGEQGRGFAVVANEVRELATRCANAARDVRRLIETSDEQVSSGSNLVASAREAAAEMAHSVKAFADLLRDIAQASSEQRSALAQINEAIMQIDHMTQQNAHLVEKSASATEGLKNQSDALLHAVDVFKMRSGP